MELPDLLTYLEKLRGKNRRKQEQPLSADDIERSIQKLAILGSGLRVMVVGKRKLVQMVPCELDNDHAAVLNAAQETG
jgi:ESCRT-II complex subunit VPS22